MPSTELTEVTQSQRAALAGVMDVLIDADALRERVQQLGARITEDFAEHVAEGIVAVGVLRGAFPFFADLVRHIDLPLDCEFVRLSSYGDAKQTSGEVRMAPGLDIDIAGKHVLVIEDIVDSGLSMQHLVAHAHNKGAKSVSVCTLLHKGAGTRVEVPLRYVGFPIPDAFVVGYGLDYEGKLRNLPCIGVVRTGCEAQLRRLLTGDARATH